MESENRAGGSLAVFLKKNKDVVILGACIFVHTLLLYKICDFEKAMETYGDELIYYNLARCIFRGEALKVHGVAFSFPSLAYCYYLAPFFCIADGVLRMRVITLANAFLMSLCVIPVWLICRELELKKRYAWFSVILIMLWPDMLTAGTLMTENLYWMLSLFAMYFCIKSIGSKKKTVAAAAAFFCYLSNFCKSVGVCLGLAYMAYMVIYPCLDRLSGKSRHTFRKFMKDGEWIKPVVFAAVYGICYVAVRKLLLHNMNDADYTVETAVFSSSYQCFYMVYAVLYYVLGAAMAFMVFPVFYPVLHYRKISRKTQNAYLYAVILLLGTFLVVVLKITVVEDLGKNMPRVHLRYFASMAGLFLPVFFRSVSDTEGDSAYMRKGKLVSILFCFFFWGICMLGFKGVKSGCITENLALSLVQFAVGNLQDVSLDTDGMVVFPLSAIAVSMVVGIVLAAWNLVLYSGKLKKYFSPIVFVSMAFVCMINVWLAIPYLHGYDANRSAINEMCTISTYFREHGLDECNVLFVCENGYGKDAKIYDTYFEGTNNFETRYDMLFREMDLSGQKDSKISEMNFTDCIWEGEYHIDMADYLIFNAPEQDIDRVIGGCEILPEISGEHYTVYRNTDPERIRYPEKAEVYRTGDILAEIRFAREGYNVPLFVQKGISLCEEDFSWTDGSEMEIRVRVPKETGTVTVMFDLKGTYNGKQGVEIYQGERMIYDGVAEGEQKFSFELHPQNGDGGFKVRFPDAVSPMEMGVGQDARKLAVALHSITVSHE